MKNMESALRWIVSILNKHDILFQITGGLAARLYGSSRELADIDIDITDDNFSKILPEIEEYVVFGPGQYIDENWNVKLLTLEYKGQLIDIAGGALIFDKNLNKWVSLNTNLLNTTLVSIYGITVPVITKQALLEYKGKLLREVDREDIKALSD